jgi:SAM-dependent methyltransferase
MEKKEPKVNRFKPPVCDYEGSDYRTRFWEGRGRDYEDAAERIALKALLPPAGRRLVEIGAGYGRLADLYAGYDQVVLLDYARSQLRQAQHWLGRDGRFVYVAADLYNLPLADSAVDTAVTVRTLHHVADLGWAFAEIARVVRPGGSYVLEYANKRHLKAIVRWLVGRQAESPFSRRPYEFVPLNFDFHPAYVEARLSQAGFVVGRQRAVSTFRLAVFKQHISPARLATVDGWLQAPTAPLKLAPSVFVHALVLKPGRAVVNPVLWRCPRCHSTDLAASADELTCSCGAAWPIENGIYDFKGGESDRRD